ncbi:MAG: NUDIX domain-containing protein, partial [Bacteroidota bacterium]|nr:NUDIX domain-containing protein [Bacteroidota bacterium]
GVLVRKRAEKDIWENLYEFYLFETEKELKWRLSDISKWLLEQLGVTDFLLCHTTPSFKQQLTHQTLSGSFVKIKLPSIPPTLRDFSKLNQEEFSSIAFPKFINQYLDQFPLTIKEI